MPQGWIFVVSAFLYIGLLFAVASWGDRLKPRRGRPYVYALSLAVYCTSWTFLGSVGLAARSGLDFLTIYIGPMLLIGLGAPLVARVARLAKARNITSIADFIAARYGKSQAVAAAVSLIAIIGSIPYIALQLKAVSASLTTLVARDLSGDLSAPFFEDVALFVALALATFAVLFGARHTDATEHQEGMMLAIAAESAVKLAAFLVVGSFVLYAMFDGIADLWSRAEALGATAAVVRPIDGPTWLTMTFLSFVCALLLPRQFHVAVVENGSPAEIRRAAWMFPLYLVLINLFVIPVALAGLVVFPGGGAAEDLFVLALPMAADAPLMTLLAFIGGLSAATAMVIVESVALAIMASNEIMVPLILRRKSVEADRADMGRLILNLRRASIFAILLLAYGYHRATGASAALAEIGLLSFAAIAQFAPAFFGGLIWRSATAPGALAGMLTGFAVWAYTLLLPTFAAAGLISDRFLHEGLFGLAALKPQSLLFTDMPLLVHSVFWSLSLNIAAYIGVSLLRRPTAIERVQAAFFAPSMEQPPLPPALRLWRSAVTVEDLRTTLSRYLGEERTERAFADYAEGRPPLTPTAEADASLLQYTERLLASAIGAASSRVVLSLLMTRRNISRKAALRLLDDASAALEYNRDLLQTALDHVRQGIAVFDSEMRLICWNRQFRDLLDLSDDVAEAGAPLSKIIRFMAMRGDFGSGTIESHVAMRFDQVAVRLETFQQRFGPSGAVLEVRTARLPHGGLVATYTDITEKVRAAEALALANESLEQRVRQRTEELTRLNAALEAAKAQAEEANLSKTRFLAAAGHDILQPLSAARLYAAGLTSDIAPGAASELARNIDSSLEAVEEILSVLLDISRLDSGVLKPEISAFPIESLLRRLRVEFEPMARAKGLRFDIVGCGAHVRSDRRMLLRVLRNLVSNAVKYTSSGRVLIGCRRRDGRLWIEVHDSGPGIHESKHRLIFGEFQRLEEGVQTARGLGLGLSIVERIARALGARVDLKSRLGRGTIFSVETPIATPEAVPSGLQGFSVVCIDNEPKILDGMESLLRGWGVRALCAADGEEALRRLDGLAADGLLVDYHLDDGDGISTIVSLRAILGEEIPGALITADASAEVRAVARSHDLTVLSKPLKPAQLRALLSAWKASSLPRAEEKRRAAAG